jgi:BRCT domain type II-containing protein
LNLSKIQIYELIFFLINALKLLSCCQEVPEGAPNCLDGLTFVISGTLDRYSHKSVDLHEAELCLQIIACPSLTPSFSIYYFVDVHVHVLFPCTSFRSSIISCHFNSFQSLYFFLFLIYSLEREEAEDLIKRHGGRVTGSVSKKTVI